MLQMFFCCIYVNLLHLVTYQLDYVCTGLRLTLVQPGRSIFGFSWPWIVITRVCPDALSYTVVINPPPSSQVPACSVHIMIF